MTGFLCVRGREASREGEQMPAGQCHISDIRAKSTAGRVNGNKETPSKLNHHMILYFWLSSLNSVVCFFPQYK